MLTALERHWYWSGHGVETDWNWHGNGLGNKRKPDSGRLRKKRPLRSVLSQGDGTGMEKEKVDIQNGESKEAARCRHRLWNRSCLWLGVDIGFLHGMEWLGQGVGY